MKEGEAVNFQVHGHDDRHTSGEWKGMMNEMDKMARVASYLVRNKRAAWRVA